MRTYDRRGEPREHQYYRTPAYFSRFKTRSCSAAKVLQPTGPLASILDAAGIDAAAMRATMFGLVKAASRRRQLASGGLHVGLAHMFSRIDDLAGYTSAHLARAARARAAVEKGQEVRCRAGHTSLHPPPPLSHPPLRPPLRSPAPFLRCRSTGLGKTAVFCSPISRASRRA